MSINDAIVRTTIDISDALLAELRKRAGERGKSFREVIEETLQIGLAGTALPRSGEVRLKTYPVGIKAAYRGTSLNQLYDQLESEDHLRASEP
ncbi:MAG: hypothetical protein EA425_04840 [Puniceicoccaceae bacterium]|nr:MAG: hypothetical protein EA425_04840 [Puniceicoccaceae bacterium]